MLTQVMTNKFMDFATSDKHGPENREQPAAVLGVLTKEFETCLKIANKIANFLDYL